MNKNYESYLKGEQKSQNTIKIYLSHVEDCLNFVGKEDKDITVDDLIAYKASISNYSSATVALKINAIKNYFNYLRMTKVITEDPSLDITVPKVKNKVKPYITSDDVQKLLNNAHSSRDRALISIVASTGMRIEEMANISMEQYNNMKKYGNRNITIIGKGSKERQIYINDNTMALIDTYVAKKPDGKGLLFESYRGNELSTSNVDKMLKNTAHRAGLSYWKDMSCHCLRVAFATIANAKGVDIPTISAAIGHSNIATTSRYIKTCQNNIDEAMKNMIF